MPRLEVILTLGLRARKVVERMKMDSATTPASARWRCGQQDTNSIPPTARHRIGLPKALPYAPRNLLQDRVTLHVAGSVVDCFELVQSMNLTANKSVSGSPGDAQGRLQAVVQAVQPGWEILSAFMLCDVAEVFPRRALRL